MNTALRQRADAAGARESWRESPVTLDAFSRRVQAAVALDSLEARRVNLDSMGSDPSAAPPAVLVLPRGGDPSAPSALPDRADATLRASDYDHDPNLGLRGAEERSAAAEMRSDVGGPRPVRMYVYDIAALNLSSMCFGEIDYDSPMSDFTYETHLEAELRAVTEVVTDPSSADFFLLPVCLSQFWASTVSWNDEGTLVSSCGNCLQDYEARLLAAMRGVGPWYDDNPGRHLVSRHRCPSHNEPKNTWIIAGGMQAAFPELWHSAKVAYACVESVLPSTGADLDMYRAVTREVHLPYFTNGNAMEAVPPATQRSRSVGFAGSLRHRDWISEEMKEEVRPNPNQP